MYSVDYLIEAIGYAQQAKGFFNGNDYRNEIWAIEKAMSKLSDALVEARKEHKESK